MISCYLETGFDSRELTGKSADRPAGVADSGGRVLTRSLRRHLLRSSLILIGRGRI